LNNKMDPPAGRLILLLLVVQIDPDAARLLSSSLKTVGPALAVLRIFRNSTPDLTGAIGVYIRKAHKTGVILRDK